MTAPEHLLTLAERVEASEGADRELDVAVACAAYRWLREGDRMAPAPSGGGRVVHYYAGGRHGTSTAPAYTRSIESVLDHLDLGGELWAFELSRLSNNRWTAGLSTENGDGASWTGAATRELALLAAALRARAALSKDMGR